MTKGKSYNRIVFLTTLSVYLGLVLAGATPQALSYAATTRVFDIQNEIELKDDLDNKPDDCQEAEKVAQEKLQSLKKNKDILTDYALSLKNIIALSHKADFDEFSFKLEDSDYETLIINAAKPILFPSDTRQEIKDDLKLVAATFLVPQYSNSGWYGINLEFDSRKNHLNTKTVFDLENESDAFEYASAYNASLELGRCKSKNTFEGAVYENTKITPKNNQVFIVTRLPRGSIDSLLANNE